MPTEYADSGTLPDSVKQRRRLFEAMMMQGVDTSPVGHWTQGGARLMNALVGGYGLYRADQSEKAEQRRVGDILARTFAPGGPTAAPETGSAPQPPSAPPTSEPSMTANNDSSASGSRLGLGRRVYDFFTGTGFQPHQAAAVAGNMAWESGGRPDLVNPGDNWRNSPRSPHSAGLGQWNDRLPDLIAMARGMGVNIPQGDLRDQRYVQDVIRRIPPEMQMEFAHAEMNTSEGRAGRNIQGAPDLRSATAGAIGYHRPAGWTPGNPTAGHGFNNRLGLADRIMRAGAPPVAGPAAAAPAAAVVPPQPPQAPPQEEPLIPSMPDGLPPLPGVGGQPQPPPAAAPQPQPGLTVDSGPQEFANVPTPAGFDANASVRPPVEPAAPQQPPAPAAQQGFDPDTARRIQMLVKSGNPQLVNMGMQLWRDAVTASRQAQYDFVSAGDQLVRVNKRTGQAEPVPGISGNQMPYSFQTAGDGNAFVFDKRTGRTQRVEGAEPRPPEAVRTAGIKADQAYQNLSRELDSYLAMIKQNGVSVLPGQERDTLMQSRRNIQLQLKELYNLGVLNGPDLALMEQMLYDPSVGMSWTGPRGLSNLVTDPTERATSSVTQLKKQLLGIRNTAARAAGMPAIEDAPGGTPPTGAQRGQRPPAGTTRVIGGRTYVRDDNSPTGWAEQ